MSRSGLMIASQAKCWGCGCTNEEACLDDGMPCEWVDAKQNFCSVCAIGYADGLMAAAARIRQAEHPIITLGL